MLEFIQGELVSKSANYVVMQAGGLGYRLQVSAFTLNALPPVKNETMLYTYLYIREDDISLYGFKTEEEKELFITLLSVSGIGPKLAMAILSKVSSSDFRRAIILGDTNLLTGIPGVGKKTAERMILELKDKIGKLDAEAGETATAGSVVGPDVRNQAVMALLALGYNLSEAQKAIPVLKGETETTVEELVKIGLKNLARL